MTDINLDGLSPRELDALIQKAERMKYEAVSATKKRLKAEFERLAREAGLTLEDVLGTYDVSAPTKEKKKVAPKYFNPDNDSETWTGRGKPPKWFSAGKYSKEQMTL